MAPSSRSPLPFPAAEFLADPAVRLAIARKDHDVIVVLVLMACAGWQANHDRGSFPDDPERIAAIVGLPADTVTRAVDYWTAEGWITRENGSLYIPSVTRASAEEEAFVAAQRDRAQTASLARWRPPQNSVLFDIQTESSRNATAQDWPRDPVSVACDVWNEKFGKGAAAGGKFAAELKILRKAGAEWPEVLESLQRYIAFTEAKYASPAGWRQRWRTFLVDAPEQDQQSLDVARSIDGQMRRGGFESVDSIVKRGGRS